MPLRARATFITGVRRASLWLQPLFLSSLSSFCVFNFDVADRQNPTIGALYRGHVPSHDPIRRHRVKGGHLHRQQRPGGKLVRSGGECQPTLQPLSPNLCRFYSPHDLGESGAWYSSMNQYQQRAHCRVTILTPEPQPHLSPNPKPHIICATKAVLGW